MLIFESPRQSWGLIFNFLFGKYIKFKKCLKIGISNSYFSTCICWYWPIPMPTFESPRGSQRLLFTFFMFYGKFLKRTKISMISGFQLGYSEMSPLHLPAIKSELLGQKISFMAPLSTTIWNCHNLLICKDLLWTDSSSFVNGGEWVDTNLIILAKFQNYNSIFKSFLNLFP